MLGQLGQVLVGMVAAMAVVTGWFASRVEVVVRSPALMISADWSIAGFALVRSACRTWMQEHRMPYKAGCGIDAQSLELCAKGNQSRY